MIARTPCNAYFPPTGLPLTEFPHPTAARHTLRFPMLDDLPTNIEATLLRPRAHGADGVPHIELPHDPDT